MTKKSELPDDWLEYGEAAFNFICKKLKVKPAYISNKDFFIEELADLMQSIGGMALLHLNHEISKMKTNTLLKKLGDHK